jgi:hypothetical protein
VLDADVGDSFVGNGAPCEDFRQRVVDVPIDEQAHVVSADLMVFGAGSTH